MGFFRSHFTKEGRLERKEHKTKEREDKAIEHIEIILKSESIQLRRLFQLLEEIKSGEGNKTLKLARYKAFEKELLSHAKSESIIKQLDHKLLKKTLFKELKLAGKRMKMKNTFKR